jgi:hypothetical protein
LAKTFDFMNPALGDHCLRVAYLAMRLAEELEWPAWRRREAAIAGALHDIGAFSLTERLDLMEFETADKGVHARSHRFRLKPFTLIGATTRVGLLSAPLRDRFGIFRNLDFYGMDELVQITKRSAALLQMDIGAEGALELARRSRGTPRIVNRLLKRVRDYAQVRADGVITDQVAGFVEDWRNFLSPSARA